MAQVFQWDVFVTSCPSRILLDKTVELPELKGGVIKLVARHQLVPCPKRASSSLAPGLKFDDERAIGNLVKVGLFFEEPEDYSTCISKSATIDFDLTVKSNTCVILDEAGSSSLSDDIYVITGGHLPLTMIGQELSFMITFAVEDSRLGTLYHELARSFDSGDLSDVEIVLEDGTTKKCHKFVLSLRSEVFKRMFVSEEFADVQAGVIRVKDISAETMEALLKYLYTDFVAEQAITVDLMIAADKYQIARLCKICENRLLKHLNTDNVIEILVAAYLVDSDKMLKAVMKFLCSHKEAIEVADWSDLKSTYPDIANRMLETMLGLQGSALTLEKET